MPTKDAQYDVHKWVQQFKVEYFKPMEIIAQMMEELGELAREINNRYGPRTKKSQNDTAGESLHEPSASPLMPSVGLSH